MQRVRIAGTVRQDRFIEMPSVGECAALVQGDGVVERVAQRNPPPPFT
jgi:hypothetical protein